MPPPTQLVYEAGCLEIDTGRRELRARGVRVPIGGRAFEIIEALARSAGELVTKDELIGRVWPGAIAEESTLQVHISAIRKALGPDRAILKTTSGRGYRLLGRWTARQENIGADPVDRAPARAPAQLVQSNVPIAASDLIGRAAAVQHLHNLISAYRIVTLTGPGGIGKTKLALEIARGLLPSFDGDVWWVELATLSDTSLVTAAIVSVLGLHLGGNDISPESLARAIGGRKLLLVIDNCEHVIDAAARVVDTVIRLCPGASVLATSRELMRIDGECMYRLPPLDLPEQDASEADHHQILEKSAIRLFIARATTWHSGRPSQDELSAIAAICRRLDGIPLAIEFAAARAAMLGVEEVLSRLDNRFALLTSGRRTALPKHRTLRATLDWSYDLLSGSERQLLQRLAIFAAAFSLEAANAVAGSGETPTADISEDIANLVAKSLVTADTAGAPARFRLLETARAYAFEKLTEGGESRRISRRHAEYYRGLLERIEDQRETRPASLVDLANARAALEWCFGTDGDSKIGVGLAAAAAPIFLAMSLLTECHRWSERAILALDDATRAGHEEMHLQAALGMSLMFTRGSSDAVRVALDRSLVIAEERDDARMQLRLLGTLNMFHGRIGDLETALRYAKRGSAVSKTIADPVAHAVAHSLLGLSLQIRGDFAGARMELEAALRHGPGSRQTSMAYLGFDGYNIAGVALARTLWLQGHPVQAVDRASQTVKDAAGLDHPVTLSIVLIWAVSVFLWAGDLQRAEQHIDWFVSRAESYSLGPYRAVGRGFKGQLAIRRSDSRGGVESLLGSLAELRAARYEQVNTLFNISLVQGLEAIGRFDEALTLIDESIQRVAARGELCYMPELLRVKGNVLLSGAQPNRVDAEMYFMRSLELSRRQGARAWELRTAVDLATLMATRGQAADARTLLRPVFDQFVEGFDTADAKAAQRLLANLG